jgi:hypothetical protein
MSAQGWIGGDGKVGSRLGDAGPVERAAAASNDSAVSVEAHDDVGALAVAFADAVVGKATALLAGPTGTGVGCAGRTDGIWVATMRA